jgi:hypothetical protein
MCALMADGTVRCWGNNQYGQLGDGSTIVSFVPVAVLGITGLLPATSVREARAFGRTLAPAATIPSRPLHVVTSNATLASLDVSWDVPVSHGGLAITDYTIEFRKVGALSWTAVSHAASTGTSTQP